MGCLMPSGGQQFSNALVSFVCRQEQVVILEKARDFRKVHNKLLTSENSTQLLADSGKAIKGLTEAASFARAALKL